MTSETALVAKARQCLDKAAPIPGIPSWHLARGTADNKAVMQNAVDYLTCKAKAKMPFTEEEKRFLVELFEAFSLGGKVLSWIPGRDGLPEAAMLAKHYVHGGGKTVEVDSNLYKSSVIVRDTMAAMKEFIKESVNKKKPIPPLLQSNDPSFMRSKHFGKLSLYKGNRNSDTQGYVRDDNGVLVTEQNNKRLHYADNRFFLHAFSTFTKFIDKTRVHTRWRVDSIWDYEPFGKKDDGKHISEIPMGYSREHILKLPDGLSQYMTVLGIAKVFDYWAEWYEIWDF